MFLLLVEHLSGEITVVCVVLLMHLCLDKLFFLFNWINGALDQCFLCTDNRLY